MLLENLDGTTALRVPGAGPEADLIGLRLVCVVRAGDGYRIRAVGRVAELGRTRRHLDISFGDEVDRGRAAAVEAAVRHIQRWCDDGTPVELVRAGEALTLRAEDGTEVALPRKA